MAFTPIDHASWDIFTDPQYDWTPDNTVLADVAFAPGRFGGHAADFTNTGFGQKSLYRAIGGASGYYFHFAYRQYVDLSGHFGNPGIAVFSIEKPSMGLQLLTLKTRLDGKLDVTAASTTKTTTAVFTFGVVSSPSSGVWRSIEVLYDVSGNVRVYVDDALDVDMAVTTSNNDPERLRFYWANFGSMGVQVDDYVHSKSNSVAASERQGPMRIAGWRNKVDEIAGFGRVGAASNALAVGDRNGVTASAPDNDTTYVQSTIPAKDLYILTPADICTGRDLAVATTLIAKAPSGGTPSMEAICRADPTNSLITVIGVSHPLTSSYEVLKGYSTLSPLTGLVWTDGEIEKALWGLRSTGSGISRATMLTIEKIQSLRNVPFSCGRIATYAVKGK